METFKFTDKLGKDIFFYKWSPNDRRIKGVVQIAHGMTERAIRYDYFAKRLTEAGYIVYANDHRGHGKTAGDVENLGFVADEDGFNLMVENMKELNDIIRENNDNLEVILFGHSMGSFLSQKYVQIYGDTVDKLILSGSNGKPRPITKLGKGLANIQMKIKGRRAKSPLMDKLSFGDFNRRFDKVRTKYDWMCSNEEEIDKYIADEYCGFISTTSFYYDLINGIWDIHEEKNLKCLDTNIPIYIFSGDKDPVGEFGEGIINLYNVYKSCGVKNVSYKLYKNGRHEMLNEKNKDEVIDDILDWLEKDSNK